MRPLGVKDFSPAFRAAVVERFQTMTAGKVAKLFGLRSKKAVYDLVDRAKRHPISTVSVHKAVDNSVKNAVVHGNGVKSKRLTPTQSRNAQV
jgi:hypothetical protein